MDPQYKKIAAMSVEARERVFLVMAAFFLSSITILNVISITKFIQLGPLALAVGVLPYPLTFLCTDLISEIYGRARANFVVLVGLMLNVFTFLVIAAGNFAPAAPLEVQPPWQMLNLAEPVPLPDGSVVSGDTPLFSILFATTSSAVFASMMAYIAAQFVDVQVFHFVKRLTKGKHRWLRNNVSTLFSQMVDSVLVITVTFGAAFARGDIALGALLALIGSSYIFKMTVALLDTIPFYLITSYLRR